MSNTGTQTHLLKVTDKQKRDREKYFEDQREKKPHPHQIFNREPFRLQSEPESDVEICNRIFNKYRSIPGSIERELSV